MHQQEWLEALRTYAQDAKKKWQGMRVSCCLAQAALETGWGKRVIGKWNLWGIKDVKWHAGAIRVDTHEMIGGKLAPLALYFEDLISPTDAFDCYGRLVTNALAYADARAATTLEDYVHRLGEHWSTNPRYAGNVLAIIAMYNLAPWDGG